MLIFHSHISTVYIMVVLKVRFFFFFCFTWYHSAWQLLSFLLLLLHLQLQSLSFSHPNIWKCFYILCAGNSRKLRVVFFWRRKWQMMIPFSLMFMSTYNLHFLYSSSKIEVINSKSSFFWINTIWSFAKQSRVCTVANDFSMFWYFFFHSFNFYSNYILDMS